MVLDVIEGPSRTNECHAHAELTHVVLIGLTLEKYVYVQLTGTPFYIPCDNLNRVFPAVVAIVKTGNG